MGRIESRNENGFDPLEPAAMSSAVAATGRRVQTLGNGIRSLITNRLARIPTAPKDPRTVEMLFERILVLVRMKNRRLPTANSQALTVGL